MNNLNASTPDDSDDTESDTLPCPFCGSMATAVVKAHHPDEGDKCFVLCKDCGTTGPAADDIEDALDAWESRTEITRIYDFGQDADQDVSDN